jgi:signal transduction histidine kinase
MELNKIEAAIENRIKVLRQILKMTEAFKSVLSIEKNDDFLRVMTDTARLVTRGMIAVCGRINQAGRTQVDKISTVADLSSSSAEPQPEIDPWLIFWARNRDKDVNYFTKDQLLRSKSALNLPVELSVPNGLLAGAFQGPGSQNSDCFLMVLDKDRGDFSVEDMALLIYICKFMSLVRLSNDHDYGQFSNFQLMTMIQGIPGFIASVTDKKRQRVDKIAASHDSLKDKVEENAASLYMTVKALEDEVEERRRIEKQLRGAQEHQRFLVRKTVETLENDRQMIAKELHDSIGASLAAIKFSIEDALSKMGQQPQAAIGRLKKVVGYLLDTIKETKRISANLRPATLDELGLLPTIRWFCRKSVEVYQDTNISHKVDIEEEKVPDELKIVIYRVLQEAVNNAIKHGNADNIEIALRSIGSDIELVVTDDGCGFDRGKQLHADPLSGHGIQGMIERVEICGGRLHLNSVPGKGTQLSAVIPSRLPGK